jgi:hypothetical protein
MLWDSCTIDTALQWPMRLSQQTLVNQFWLLGSDMELTY